MVAVVLIGVLLTSAAVGLVGATRAEGALRGQQVAVRLALQALDLARAASYAPDAQGCVPVLHGRTPGAVQAQWAAAPARLDLSGTDPASTPSACTDPAIVPLAGLPEPGGGAARDPVVVGGTAFAVRTYVGTCRLPTSGGACVAAADLPGTAWTELYRVVVSVTWTAARGCAGGCLYTASTLVDASDDPLFDARSPAPSAPTAIDVEAGDASAVVTWGPPVSEGDSPLLGYRVTASPTEGGAAATVTVGPEDSTATLTGLVDGLTYAVSVAAWSAAGDGAAAWTAVVPYPADVLSDAATALWLDAASADTLFTDAAGTTRAVADAQDVRLWADRSAAGNDATVRAGQAPPRTTALHGRLVPTFDGSTTCLEVDPALLPRGTDGATVFAAVTPADAAPAGEQAVVTWGGGGTGDGRRLVRDAGGTGWTADRVGTQAAQDLPDPGGTAPHVLVARFDATTTSLWSAGRAAVSAGPGWLPTGASGAGIGCSALSAGAAAHWDGQVHEVAVVEGAVAGDDRRRVEEYLARKWGAVVTAQAPAPVTVTPGGAGTLAVVWGQPGWDGGSPPTGFTATAEPGGATCTSTASGCVLTGLTAGTDHAVTVTAANAAGDGPASDPVTGTP